jgi:hypothetical protein
MQQKEEKGKERKRTLHESKVKPAKPSKPPSTKTRSKSHSPARRRKKHKRMKEERNLNNQQCF